MKLEHIEAKTGNELAVLLANLLEHVSATYDKQPFAKIIYALAETGKPWHAFVFYERLKEDEIAE